MARGDDFEEASGYLDSAEPKRGSRTTNGDLCESRNVMVLVGTKEISRWCQPPVNGVKGAAPRRVAGTPPAEVNVPSALRGEFFFFCGYRWLAPPANFWRPSGPKITSEVFC